MKCLYYGCVKEAVTEGFCDTCYSEITKAKVRLREKGGIINARLSVFKNNLGVEKNYDLIDEMNLQHNKRGGKRKAWYDPDGRFDYDKYDS